MHAYHFNIDVKICKTFNVSSKRAIVWIVESNVKSYILNFVSWFYTQDKHVSELNHNIIQYNAISYINELSVNKYIRDKTVITINSDEI